MIDFIFDDKQNIDLFEHSSKFISRGLGRSYGDAAQLTGGKTIRLQTPNFYQLDKENGILEVSANCSINYLIKEIVSMGWFLPVIPGTRYVTIGGAIAADIHGKNHHQDGSFGNFVVNLDLLTPNGKIKCSKSANSELFWATIGGMGLTGLILSAKIKLIKIDSSLISATIKKFKNIYTLVEYMSSHDVNVKYSVAWIDMLASGSHLGRGILSVGDHAKFEDLPSKLKEKKFNYSAEQKINVPFYFPSKVLNQYTTKLFNEIWYLKDKKESKKILTIPSFFHPLDGVKNWNRIYGKLGFIQYQFVVPIHEVDFLINVLSEFSKRGIPIFLAVLKKMGKSNEGLLSFAKPGWTLALDIPVRISGLEAFLDELDEKIIARAGRIYLAKDSLLNPKKLEKMYPKLNEFKRIREKHNLKAYLESDLSRRLGI